MRIILFIFLFLPILVFSQINQTDANGHRQGLWQKKQSNGRLIYEGHFKNGKPIGEWKRYHPGGQVKALIVYKGDTAQTQLFDVWGKKIAGGNYVNQKKEGTWSYFKNNRMVSDEQFVNGEKNGVAHKYYDTGEVMEESNWENRKQDGNYQVFFKTGKPYMQCKMKDNQRNGLFIVSFENGRQEMVAEYKNNLRHGEWKYFNKEGEYRYSLHYNEGQILNPAVRDSVENLVMQNLEKNKGAILDPEKFMQNPTEYMIKKKIYR
ncbi:MAG: hypothetical protein ABFS16_04195 [Bacteroidota bacterium]